MDQVSDYRIQKVLYLETDLINIWAMIYRLIIHSMKPMIIFNYWKLFLRNISFLPIFNFRKNLFFKNFFRFYRFIAYFTILFSHWISDWISALRLVLNFLSGLNISRGNTKFKYPANFYYLFFFLFSRFHPIVILINQSRIHSNPSIIYPFFFKSVIFRGRNYKIII